MKVTYSRPVEYGKWFGFCLQRTSVDDRLQLTAGLWYWIVGFYF